MVNAIAIPVTDVPKSSPDWKRKMRHQGCVHWVIELSTCLFHELFFQAEQQRCCQEGVGVGTGKGWVRLDDLAGWLTQCQLASSRFPALQ